MRRIIISTIYLIVVTISAFGQNEIESPLTQLNKTIDFEFCNPRTHTPPTIGVSAMRRADGGSFVPGVYIKAVEDAGGVPVVIPVTTDGVKLRKLLDNIDGLLLTGGDDVDPTYYGEKKLNSTVLIDVVRDTFDLSLARLASNMNIPILGICRGMQVLNIAFGGTLYQDLPTQKKSQIQHKPTTKRDKVCQTTSIFAGTKLAELLGVSDTLAINSYHHQSVKKVATEFKISAVAPDGVIEGMEAYPYRRILAVQWHPEALTQNYPAMRNLFTFIVDEAKKFKHAKELHKNMLSIDTHTDTPLNFVRVKGFDFGKRENSCVNIPKMKEGMLDGVFLAAYMFQGARDVQSSKNAVKHFNEIIDSIYSQVNNNKDLCEIAYTTDDLIRLKKNGKKAVFIGIENGYAIGKDISNLKKYKDRGVNYITLSHTIDNDICDASSRTKNEWGGLSPFGYEVVHEMNNVGIMIDISHVHENTFWNVIKETKVPVIASHSSVRALCDHDRNMNDKQLKALAENGGVIQLSPVDIFVVKGGKNKATIDQFIDHIDYAVNLIGIDHVGIGTDFDGGGGLVGLRGANDIINITIKLIERGYTDEDIAKIWGKNLLRVLDEVQNYSKNVPSK